MQSDRNGKENGTMLLTTNIQNTFIVVQTKIGHKDTKHLPVTSKPTNLDDHGHQLPQ